MGSRGGQGPWTGMRRGLGSAYIHFPSLGGVAEPVRETRPLSPQPALSLLGGSSPSCCLQSLPHPSSPLARPPLISGVLMASRMGGEGASLESEDWSLQTPLVMMESSLPLASSSLLSCLVSPFIVSCRRARMGRVAGKQGHKGAAQPNPPTNSSRSSGPKRSLDRFSGGSSCPRNAHQAAPQSPPPSLTKLGGSGLGSMWPGGLKAQIPAPRTEEGVGLWSEA